ncbi:MAG: hypothetical protein ACPGPS_04110 [Rubripirellula sp.]
MSNANEALLHIYDSLMKGAEIEARNADADLHECCQAQLEWIGYHGVDVDALDLMRDNDPSIVCVLCTGDVARIKGKKVIWTTTTVAMN